MTGERTDAPLERIELIDSEEIVAHGACRTEWYLRSGDGWLRAARAPEAVSKPLQAPPGTVWQVCVELNLPIGTRLMRVTRRPERETQQDAFQHLLRGKRSKPIHTDRRYYRVGRHGTLKADPRG